jgi:hypothetical protein
VTAKRPAHGRKEEPRQLGASSLVFSGSCEIHRLNSTPHTPQVTHATHSAHGRRCRCNLRPSRYVKDLSPPQ